MSVGRVALDVARRTLPNGVRVVACRNPDGESVVIAGLVVGGAALDPQGREGLANFAATVAQRATTSRSYEQLHDTLDSLGAAFSMGCGRHAISFRAKCVRGHWRTVAELAADVLRNASFPEEEVEKARGELLTALRQDDDNTRFVADRELGHLVYPEGHPYRHPVVGYRRSVEAVSRDDLAACHERLFKPGALIVAVVGDLDPDEVFETMGGLVADWDGSPPATPDLAVPPLEATRRKTVAMADKSQADIALGFPAIGRQHPDFYALSQATEIIGRLGLMGRLGENIRDKQGLAYYVYATFERAFGPALWSAHAGVNPANVQRATQGILEEVRRIQDEPVSDEEIADVQSHLVGVMPIMLETNDGVASTLASIALFDLGDDYLERYPELVRSVTKDDIQRAAQTYLNAETYALAVAGPVGD